MLIISLLIFCLPTIRAGVVSSHTYATPCSTNLTQAYLDIVLAIDVSSNMEERNLRQIALSISSEFTKLNLTNATWGGADHTSRVMLVTYASNYTVVGSFQSFPSVKQLSEALLSLKVSKNDSSVGGLCSQPRCQAGALEYVANWTDNFGTPGNWDTYEDANRPTVLVAFMASLNHLNTNDVFDRFLIINNYVNVQRIIAINYNFSNTALTSFLEQQAQNDSRITYLPSNLHSLYSDLMFSLSQANCFSAPIIYDPQLYDPATGIKYGDIFNFEPPYVFANNTPLEVCLSDSDPGLRIPAAPTSDFKADFLDKVARSINGGLPAYYIGLHRNANKQWVWYDYDKTEFPMGTFSRWAPGFGVHSAGDCVVAKFHNTTGSYLWKTTSCVIDNSIYVACNYQACDAENNLWGCSPNGVP